MLESMATLSLLGGKWSSGTNTRSWLGWLEAGSCHDGWRRQAAAIFRGFADGHLGEAARVEQAHFSVISVKLENFGAKKAMRTGLSSLQARLAAWAGNDIASCMNYRREEAKQRTLLE
jgi:hypothetical protein